MANTDGDDGARGVGAAPAAHGRRREPAHRVRHDGWTGERQRLFLDALAQVGNVRDACRRAGMSNVSAYRLRRIDAAFGQAWDAALKRAATSLEAVAFARAVDGVEEAVIRNGEEVWRKRRYSDSLLRLLLQASDPEKYGRTGANASVRAREEVEARVKEIEHAAYNRAWRALVAEYQYELEPELMRIYLHRKLTVMHLRICANALCPECHPERAGEHSHLPPPFPDAPHDPLDGPAAWLRHSTETMQAEIARARAAGEEPDIDDRIPRW